MKRILFIYFLLLSTTLSAWATGENDKEKEGKEVTAPKVDEKAGAMIKTRSFPSLESAVLPVLEEASGLYNEGWFGLEETNSTDSIRYYIDKGRAVIPNLGLCPHRSKIETKNKN